MPPCINATISITKNLQHNFPKMRGGQRPFGIFPKNNPIWYRDHSLRPVLSACPTVSMILKKWVSAGYIAWVTSSTWAAPLARERWVGAASKIPNLSSTIIGQTVWQHEKQILLLLSHGRRDKFTHNTIRIDFDFDKKIRVACLTRLQACVSKYDGRDRDSTTSVIFGGGPSFRNPRGV